MNKIFIAILIALSSSFSSAMAQSESKKLIEILFSNPFPKGRENDTISSLRERLFGPKKSLPKSNSDWKPEALKATLTTLETYDGLRCHVGWCLDGCICTVLEGSKEGLQILFLHDGIVATSRQFEVQENQVIHTYDWGKVYSSLSKQEAVVEK